MKCKAQWKHRWKSVAAALLLAVSITGCSGVPSTSNVKETPGYTLPQSMIIVATERNRYQQIYTSDLWNVTLNNGMTFQIYLLDQVETFLQNMKTCLLYTSTIRNKTIISLHPSSFADSIRLSGIEVIKFFTIIRLNVDTAKGSISDNLESISPNVLISM